MVPRLRATVLFGLTTKMLTLVRTPPLTCNTLPVASVAPGGFTGLRCAYTIVPKTLLAATRTGEACSSLKRSDRLGSASSGW